MHTRASQTLAPVTAVFIVFLSNFCTLVLELVAGRLMAPRVGVNLYTWTSVIGVILAGISLGNYIGGRLADRRASRRLLAAMFVLSAAASLSVLLTVQFIGAPGGRLPVIAGVLLAFTAVFLLPAALLGTISPIVVKLTLTDLDQTGNVVGKLYAAGALGSIVGTFATGFFFISQFGTRAIVLGVAGALLLVGVLIGWTDGWRGRPIGGSLGLFAALLAGVWAAGGLQSDCLRETNYFCIQIRTDTANPQRRHLLLDRLTHSIVDLDDPTQLLFRYEQVYADVVTAVTKPDAAPSALFIGGGGYVFPRYLEATFPGSRLDVVEIDPAVTAVNVAYLALSPQTTITSINEDARRFMNNLLPDARYDLILGDAFNDVSVPYHLTTREFNEMIAAHLGDDGLFLANIIDGRALNFFRAYVYTLRQTFPYVYAAPTVGPPGEVRRQTFVIVAAKRDLTPVMAAAPLAETFLSQAELDALLQQAPPILLTDDFVPVDNLLEPLLRETGISN
ncbi:MAG: fused MFS/spermidine synthase [Anaerolineales bacterium]|nr:fused MFS/spermidine synthase [Anaerolineales bacterium]